MRRSFAALLTGAMLLGGVATNGAAATAQEGATDATEPGPTERTARLRGVDRFATAVAISQHAFPDGAPVVHLARGDVYVDALAGGVLTEGPILLVPTAGTPPQAVLDEVDRLGAGQVIALGGTAAVSEQMLGAVARNRPTSRLRGPDRYATAAAIARHRFPDGAPTTYIARTDAEALAFGNAQDGPVLLVPPSGQELPGSVHDEIRRLNVDVLVMPTLDETLLATLRTLTRERDNGTIEAAVDWAWPDGQTKTLGGQIAGQHFGALEVPVVYLAREDDPVDALAGGPLTDGPLLLTPSCTTDPAVLAELETFDPARVVALGGPGAICDAVLSTYGATARDPYPVPGLAGVRTLAREIAGSWLQVWWSRDGSTMLREESWLDDGRRRVAFVIEDLATGDTRVFHPAPGEDLTAIGISNDGSRFWANTFTPQRSVREYRSDTGEYRAVLSDPLDHAFGTTAGYEFAEDGAYVIHDLERGTSWTFLGAEEYLEYGAGRGNWPTYDPHGNWVITGTHAKGDRTYGIVKAIHADGTEELLFDRESNGCGDLVRHRVEDATSDLRIMLVVRSGRLPGGATCDDAIPLELLLVDRDAGQTVHLPAYQPEAMGYAHQGGIHLTGDGQTVVFASLDRLPEADDGTSPRGDFSLSFDRWDDGVRFHGAPPVDGSRLAIFLADVDALLAGSSEWRELGWGAAKPDLHVRSVGWSARQISWAVTGAPDGWPRLFWSDPELPPSIVAVPAW